MNYGFTEEGEQADSANNDIPVTTAETTDTTNSQVWIGDSVIKWIHKRSYQIVDYLIVQGCTISVDLINFLCYTVLKVKF